MYVGRENGRVVVVVMEVGVGVGVGADCSERGKRTRKGQGTERGVGWKRRSLSEARLKAVKTRIHCQQRG